MSASTQVLASPNLTISLGGQVNYPASNAALNNGLGGPFNLAFSNPFTVGTGTASQVNTIYAAARTTSGSTDVINLNTLPDGQNNSLGNTHVGVIVISNPCPLFTGTVAGTVTLTVLPTSGTAGVTFGQLPSAGVTIPPGGMYPLLDPMCSLPVGGTANSITVNTNGVSSFTYLIEVLGRNT